MLFRLSSKYFKYKLNPLDLSGRCPTCVITAQTWPSFPPPPDADVDRMRTVSPTAPTAAGRSRTSFTALPRSTAHPPRTGGIIMALDTFARCSAGRRSVIEHRVVRKTHTYAQYKRLLRSLKRARSTNTHTRARAHITCVRACTRELARVRHIP